MRGSIRRYFKTVREVVVLCRELRERGEVSQEELKRRSGKLGRFLIRARDSTMEQGRELNGCCAGFRA